MKKKISALFPLLFLVIFLFSGCGREQNGSSSKNPQAESLSYYQAETLSLPDNVQAVHDLQYSDGNLYLACSDSSDQLIIYVRSDNGDWQELSTDYSAQTLSAFTIDHEGGMWFTVYKDNNDQVSFLLVHLDQDGNVLLEKSINQYTEFNPSGLAADMDGNIYLATIYAVIVMDSQGELLFQLNESEGTDKNALACTRDGSVIFNRFGRMIKRLNFITQDFSDIYSVGGAGDITLGSGNDDVGIYYTNAGIYHIDVNSGASTQIMNWLDSDLLAEEITHLTATGNGDYYAIRGEAIFEAGEYWGGNADGAEVLHLTQTENQNADKTSLRFVMFEPDSSLRSAVVAFNRANADYRIDLLDYSQHNTEDDPTAGLTRFNTEIISGDVPDLFSLKGLPAETYISAGLLTDLSVFLNSDDSVSRDDLLQNVLEALHTDGGIYQMVTNYSISTALARATRVGEDSGWTLDEFITLSDSLSGGETTFACITRQEFLRLMVQANIDQFIDWDNGETHFESETFKTLLEMAGQFPSDIESSNNFFMLYDNIAVLDYMEFSDESTYQVYENLLEGDIVFKGLPTGDGTGGNTIVPITSVAISSASENKEAAWSFISYLLSEKVQDNLVSGYPLRESSLMKKLEGYMQQLSLVNGVELDDGEIKIIDLKPLDQEAIDRLVDLVKSADRLLPTDDILLDILKEEAEAYFSGDKSVDQVAETIQNRISTYVNEQQ